MSLWPSRPDARSLLTLAVPIVITQIGMVLYGTIDMMFVGRLGAEAVAAVGLASMTYFTVFCVGMGIVMGIDSHSAKAFGAGRVDVCGQLLVHTLVLALAVAVPSFFAFAAAGPVYRLFGVDPVTAADAVAFLHPLRWAVFPALAFVACRQFLQSIGVTRPLLVAIFLGNAANALFDFALIFGRLGSPRLGLMGSAYATVLANVVMLIVAAVAAAGSLRGAGFRFYGWRRRLFVDVLALGVPTGGQFLVEVAVFSAVTALAGRLGPLTLAAHQLTLNLASLTFMVPLGLGHAAAARVGQALGRGDKAEAARAGRAALALGTAFMTLTGLSFAGAPAFFLGLFGVGAAVVAAAKPLLFCSAAFQVFDGAQTVLSGGLRGWGETRRPLLYNLIGHWVVGLPIGVYLAFSRGWGAVGLWCGLVAGLTAVAGLLWVEWSRCVAA